MYEEKKLVGHIEEFLSKLRELCIFSDLDISKLDTFSGKHMVGA